MENFYRTSVTQIIDNLIPGSWSAFRVQTIYFSYLSSMSRPQGFGGM